MLKSVKKNKMISFFIVSLFIIVIMAGVYCICLWQDLNGFTSAFMALGFSIIPALISYYNCDKFVLASSGARAATREEYLQLNSILEGLCVATGLPQPKLYVMDDPSPNAFATGRNPEHAVICVTTGLLERLNKYELEGVIAHELSHIKNYDILLSTIISVFVGFVTILSDVFLRVGLRRNRRSRDNDSSGSGAAIIAIIAIIFLIISPIASTLVQLLVSRKREYLADATAVEITRNPKGLISALEKISECPEKTIGASKATAHMYISDPLKRNYTKDNIWSTHPATENRIKALENIY